MLRAFKKYTCAHILVNRSTHFVELIQAFDELKFVMKPGWEIRTCENCALMWMAISCAAHHGE